VSDESPDEQPVLVCARLLACGHIDADLTDPDAGYSLRNVLVHVRPPAGSGFPFRVLRIWLFAQLYGTPGEYVLRVRMTRIGLDEDGDAVEVGDPIEFGPWEIALPGDGNYLECVGVPLSDVLFTDPGVYEFQLWADGFEDILHTERIEARE
jgi:hypothetical protein